MLLLALLSFVDSAIKFLYEKSKLALNSYTPYSDND